MTAYPATAASVSSVGGNAGQLPKLWLPSALPRCSRRRTRWPSRRRASQLPSSPAPSNIPTEAGATASSSRVSTGKTVFPSDRDLLHQHGRPASSSWTASDMAFDAAARHLLRHDVHVVLQLRALPRAPTWILRCHYAHRRRPWTGRASSSSALLLLFFLTSKMPVLRYEIT